MTLKELIVKYGEKTSIKKRTHLTEIGIVEPYIYYIESGLVRMYTFSLQGEECTFDFVYEGDFTNDFRSYKHGTKAQIGIVTVKDCVVYRFSKETIAEAIQNSEIEIQQYIDVVENTFLRKLEREISLIRDTKYEQFEHLIENRRELFEDVPHKYIASYIGVSAQTISRFKNRLFNN